MVPAVQALLALLACLMPPPAGGPPAYAPAWGRAPAVRACAGAAEAAPVAIVEALPSFRDEAGASLDDDNEPPSRPRPAGAPSRSAPAPGRAGAAGASAHPAFHAVARSRFLLCGRLTC